MKDVSTEYTAYVTQMIAELDTALKKIDSGSIVRLVDSILSAEQVFFVGVGRVMLSLKSVCKRFSHLGIKSHCVGDITEPAITKNDLLIAASGSGESIFPVGIAKKAHQIGATVVHIGSNPSGSIREYTDYMVRIPVRTKLGLEDEIDSVQPMTSLFEQTVLLFGDALAKLIADKKQLDIASLWQHHANLE